MENKIPKTIHYCWFSGEEMPANIKECVSTWKKNMPDYTLRLWDARSFDFDSIPFVRDAYKERKWAFVTDFIRLYALYTEGGVYMDTDVKVFKPFDEFLHYNFFSSHEVQPRFYKTEFTKLNKDLTPKDKSAFIEYFSIQAATMASIPNLPYIRDCIEQYKKMNFYTEDGDMNLNSLIIGKYITREACKYGYRYADEDQLLQDNMMIKKSDVFVGNINSLTSNSYSLHMGDGSWRPKTLKGQLKRMLKTYFPSLIKQIKQLLNQ